MSVRAARNPGAGMAAEAWISIGIGILVLILFPRTLQYMSSTIFHTKFAPYLACDSNGDFIEGKASAWTKVSTAADGSRVVTVIPYRQTTAEVDPNFWSDLAITLFGIALIIEGAALVLSRRPLVVAFALLLTLTATLLNLGYAIQVYSKYATLPIISAAAVIFGIYMAIYQFRLLGAVFGQRRAATA
jgi:hypothetical protein